MSIYEFTRKKLKTHGVQNSHDGRIIFSDKRLFLMFVRLERARRFEDIVIVQKAVNEIASYCKSIGKPHLIIFSFMYLRFSDLTPHITHRGEVLSDGDIRYVKDYTRRLSQEEVAIGEWALSMFEKYERFFLRVIARGEE
ncbi:hypothetical protein QA648_24520 (plasmid) [Rhizobium sp. CB3171]|uniref:hypothetical protein n=1 Tax=Rhizobium sp. CB3171 TaxID=3039157 RepID=UPI0024B231A3|nr:hypothetical protein [Rhizobium sp. CB3171]WFU06281.1 hypothetical protein QA648_24520 [Rhizobium sp. CB3171]